MKITDMVTRDNFARYQILSTSPHYFCRKWIGVANENENLDFGFKGLKNDKHESYETFKQWFYYMILACIETKY